MAEQSGRARARRRIQTLTRELERLGQNPMLDPEASRTTHAEIWREINQLNDFLNESGAVRKGPAPSGVKKHAQRSLAI